MHTLYRRAHSTPPHTHSTHTLHSPHTHTHSHTRPQLKLVAWAAVCAVAYGLANLTSATGTQHVISAAMCSVMGLVATYANDGPSGLSALFPPPAQPPAAAAVPDASGLAS